MSTEDLVEAALLVKIEAAAKAHEGTGSGFDDESELPESNFVEEEN